MIGFTLYHTLGRGIPFYARFQDGNLEVWVAQEILYTITGAQLHNLLEYFRGREFPLGALITNPPENGLGYYIQHFLLRGLAKYSSRIAAVLVQEGYMIRIANVGRAIYLQVV
jgi:hypothetical protein